VFDLRVKHRTGLDLTAIECLGARTYIFIQFASSLRGFKTLKSETQQNILDSYSDRLSELTVRLNGLVGDHVAWGLSTQLWWETPRLNFNRPYSIPTVIG